MIAPIFHDRRIRALALLLVLLKLWLVSAQPMVVIAGAGHDDRLFVARANDLIAWRWLGPYDHLTLAKGAGYPLFIAGSFLLGLPLPVAEQLFYLFACWMLVRALRPLLGPDFWALLLLAGLVWQPMSFTVPSFGGGSVVRQNIYTPLTLLILAGVLALHTRRNAGRGIRAGWATLAGLSAGWFWLTREESVWLAPSVALLLIVALVMALRSCENWRRATWPWAIALATWGLPVGTVSALNARCYRWFGTCEFRAGEFAAAYGSLTRVQVGPELNRVPVTNAARQAIYAVSPTFARLQPWLESADSLRWRGRLDQEFNGGMWVWALRDAVKETIHPPDAGAMLEFFQRLADEVNAACDAGQIPAGPRRDSFFPPWQSEYSADLRRNLFPFARYFLLFEGFSARMVQSQSHGAPDLLNLFLDLGQGPISPTADVPAPATPRTNTWRTWRLGALQSVGQVVRGLIVAALGLGALAWFGSLAHAVWRRVAPTYLWWTAAAALGGASSVYLVSLLIHVTSWPDLRPLRFAQGYPLLVLFAGTAIVDAVQRVQSQRRQWKAGAASATSGTRVEPR